MFEDLVFTTTEKTAPNFFPEILILPHAASSQGPNRRGGVGSGDSGNGSARGGCCAAFRPYPVLGVPPCRGWVVLSQDQNKDPGNRAVTSLG